MQDSGSSHFGWKSVNLLRASQGWLMKYSPFDFSLSSNWGSSRVRRPFRDKTRRAPRYSRCNLEQKQSRGPGISPAPRPQKGPHHIPSLLSRSLKWSLPESWASPSAARLSGRSCGSSPGFNLVQTNKKTGIKKSSFVFRGFFMNTHSVSGLLLLTAGRIDKMIFWSSCSFFFVFCSIYRAGTARVEFVCSICFIFFVRLAKTFCIIVFGEWDLGTFAFFSLLVESFCICSFPASEHERIYSLRCIKAYSAKNRFVEQYSAWCTKSSINSYFYMWSWTISQRSEIKCLPVSRTHLFTN